MTLYLLLSATLITVLTRRIGQFGIALLLTLFITFFTLFVRS